MDAEQDQQKKMIADLKKFNIKKKRKKDRTRRTDLPTILYL